MRLNAALPPWLPDPAGERELGKIGEAVFTIPPQLLAYYIVAVLRGANNMDQPRNLAKSMMVESLGTLCLVCLVKRK